MRDIVLRSILFHHASIHQTFSVQLSLGEQTWGPAESSIKKAQHTVINKALTESMLRNPIQKPSKSNNNGPGNRNPTAEFNWPLMERGEPVNYRPLEPKPFSNYRTSCNFGACTIRGLLKLVRLYTL